VQVDLDVVGHHARHFAGNDAAHDQDRGGDARVAQLKGLAAVAYADGVNALGREQLCHLDGAVAVGVGLEHSHHAGVAHALANGGQVVAHGRLVDLGPDAVHVGILDFQILDFGLCCNARFGRRRVSPKSKIQNPKSC